MHTLRTWARRAAGGAWDCRVAGRRPTDVFAQREHKCEKAFSVGGGERCHKPPLEKPGGQARVPTVGMEQAGRRLPDNVRVAIQPAATRQSAWVHALLQLCWHAQSNPLCWPRGAHYTPLATPPKCMRQYHPPTHLITHSPTHPPTYPWPWRCGGSAGSDPLGRPAAPAGAPRSPPPATPRVRAGLQSGHQGVRHRVGRLAGEQRKAC